MVNLRTIARRLPGPSRRWASTLTPDEARQLLGLNKPFTQRQLDKTRSLYRRRHHPDQFQDAARREAATTEFQRGEEAYEVLRSWLEREGEGTEEAVTPIERRRDFLEELRILR